MSSPENDQDRFYADGLDDTQREIVEYVHSKENDVFVENGPAFLNKLLERFDLAVMENIRKRELNAQEPLKFLDSENLLHEAILSLSSIGSNGLQLDLVDEKYLESMLRLVGLIAHENETIVTDTFRILREILEDLEGLESSESADSGNAVVQHFLNQYQLLNAISAYLDEFNQHSSDKLSNSQEEALNSCLSLIETLAEEDIFALDLYNSSSIRAFVFQHAVDLPANVDLDTTSTTVLSADLAFNFVLVLFRHGYYDQIEHAAPYVENLLVLLSKFLAFPPDDKSAAFEYIANILGALQVIVRSARGQQEFLDNEGIDLLLMFLRKSAFVEQVVNVLNESLKNQHSAGHVSIAIVKSAGLKPIFQIYKKEVKRSGILGTPSAPVRRRNLSATSKGIIYIIASLFKWLEIGKEERIRLLGKFEEKNAEKLDMLLKQRQVLAAKVQNVYEEYNKNDEIEKEVALVDAGAEALNQLDTILAWLWIEEPKLSAKAIGSEIDLIVSGLQTYFKELQDIIDSLSGEEEKQQTQGEIEMLETLLGLVDRR